MLSFEELARRVFLDTNVVQNLASFGEYFYDGYLSPEAEEQIFTRGNRFTDDIEALASWVGLTQRGGWPIAVSQRTFLELDAIPNGTKRFRLLQWAGELKGYFSTFAASYVESEDDPYPGVRVSPESISFLPDYGDAVLVSEAIELGCSDFLTMDYKSILPYRDRIRHMGLEVLRPVEFMERLKPWTGLLR